ncbi:hypothetical protein GO755_31585 [Spirosoma sp. HMF4905]|uniref:TMF family protein n=1 Tax=Spirosoma arboris TaxID=2682092 RepID=A0A7K1SLC5_9BACT|nr:hypothetical protein [Spirosoma arboris]MVM34612.1 hypothetical protein [Spirosoma arboris]
MKFLLLIFLGIAPFVIQAQSNYVANTPNQNFPGDQNTLVGPNAGNTSMSGYDNTFIGSAAGANNTSGTYNTFIGAISGVSNRTGNDNIAIGRFAGTGNQSGGFNISIGALAGAANQTSSRNIMIGDSSGSQNTASGNVFVGSRAGALNTSGNNNLFFGTKAGFYNTTGSNNIIIGPNSGTALTTGDDNVLMGYNSQAGDGLHNATAIGAGSRVAISNALILGNNANVGIGTSTPTARLEVVSQTPETSGLKLTNLTAYSPTTQSTDQFLTVTEQGDVVKARYQLRIHNANEWSDKVFAPGYKLRGLSSVSTYINQNGHLPGVPSAEQIVKEGIDLVKMNATLLEKVEELTLYLIEQQKINQHLESRVEELSRLIKK